MKIVYGIKSCDSVKKALKWLQEHHIDAKLHDYRIDGIDQVFITQIEQLFGWETLLNKRSTTWRNLSEEVKAGLDQQSAVKLLLNNPTLIKRPIILDAKQPLIGFDAKHYQQVLIGE